VPTGIVGTLAVDGTTQPPVTFATTAHLPGDSYLLALQAPVAGTGLHSWQLNLQINLANGTSIPESTSGSAAVVDRTGPPSGNGLGGGWGLAGLDQLVPIATPGGGGGQTTPTTTPVAAVAVAGQSFSGAVATFAPPDPLATGFSATLTWPNLTTSTGTVTAW
jgi:hypothetical protein